MNIRRKILIATGIILAAGILAPIIHHYQLRFALDNYVAMLKAKGEPMELEQLLPPPVPAEQNGAPLLMEAGALLETNWGILETNPPRAMHMVARSKAMIGWTQPEIGTEDGTNSWDEEEAGLKMNVTALKILSQISDQPSLDFNLDYADGMDKIKFAQLVPLKRAVMVLSASVMDHLHHGNTVSAMRELSIMLDLTAGAEHDRLIISELVRMAMMQISVAVTWEILQTTNITDEQLAGLQRDWTRMEFIHAYENALMTERFTFDISVKKWRDSDVGFRNFMEGWELSADTRFERLKIRADALLWRYWWSYSDELYEFKGSEILLHSIRDVETNGAFFIDLQRQGKLLSAVVPSECDLSESNNESGMEIRAMLADSLLSMSHYFAQVMQAEAAREIVITAIALKRYALKDGHYPADLKSLVPGYIREIPIDPVDGLPLRYRLETNGEFLLYSVGANGVDDGGNPALVPGANMKALTWENRYALDWVWPQPASEKEIQDYFQHSDSENN